MKNVSRRSDLQTVWRRRNISIFIKIFANSDFSEILISFTYSVAIHISNKKIHRRWTIPAIGTSIFQTLDHTTCSNSQISSLEINPSQRMNNRASDSSIHASFVIVRIGVGPGWQIKQREFESQAWIDAQGQRAILIETGRCRMRSHGRWIMKRDPGDRTRERARSNFL